MAGSVLLSSRHYCHSAGSNVWTGQVDATDERFGRRVLRRFPRRGLLDGGAFRDRLCYGFDQAQDRDRDVGLGFSPGEPCGVREQAGFTGIEIAVADCVAEPPSSAVFAVAPKPTASGPAG